MFEKGQIKYLNTPFDGKQDYPWRYSTPERFPLEGEEEQVLPLKQRLLRLATEGEHLSFFPSDIEEFPTSEIITETKRYYSLSSKFSLNCLFRGGNIPLKYMGIYFFPRQIETDLMLKKEWEINLFPHEPQQEYVAFPRTFRVKEDIHIFNKLIHPLCVGPCFGTEPYLYVAENFRFAARLNRWAQEVRKNLVDKPE